MSVSDGQHAAELLCVFPDDLGQRSCHLMQCSKEPYYMPGPDCLKLLRERKTKVCLELLLPLFFYCCMEIFCELKKNWRKREIDFRKLYTLNISVMTSECYIIALFKKRPDEERKKIYWSSQNKSAESFFGFLDFFPQTYKECKIKISINKIIVTFSLKVCI